MSDFQIEHSDALAAAAEHQPGSFTMIYLDPPFFTGKKWKGKEAGDFADTWRRDIGSYVDYLGERIAAMKPLLNDRGSLFLHLDWRAVHYMKVRCDEIFGAKRFINEIIWSYRSGGGTKNRYGRKHDTILWYAAGRHPLFNDDEARVPYDAVIAKKRAHLFDDRGKVSGDVLDINRPPNHAKEWTGWPTQKPLALLEWLVKVHTRPGDLVGDFFCGSGTTLLAAIRHGRRAWGCDASADAVEIARGRLMAESDESSH
ncbi:site-specific DNA-methyltransferase [bacterium]|nr:site-specific DNA-methyltransferase [bacterium]